MSDPNNLPIKAKGQTIPCQIPLKKPYSSGVGPFGAQEVKIKIVDITKSE